MRRNEKVRAFLLFAVYYACIVDEQYEYE
jgi:hypothetical protein